VPSSSRGGPAAAPANPSAAAEFLGSDGASNWRARVVGRSLGPAADKAVRRGEALLSAAGRLIQRSGGEDLTMHKVAAEAGLSVRVLYQHFAGKDDLLIALIEESQIVLARLMQRQADRVSDPLARLGAALYFATDRRQHPSTNYNIAMTRFVAQTSVRAPEQLGHAFRPVIEVLVQLIEGAMAAGAVPEGDALEGAATINLAYVAYQLNTYLGNAVGAPLPSAEQFVRFYVQGLGAQLPDRWVDQFRMTDEQAAKFRAEVARETAGRSPVSLERSSRRGRSAPTG